jgi:hypothetical protein
MQAEAAPPAAAAAAAEPVGPPAVTEPAAPVTAAAVAAAVAAAAEAEADADLHSEGPRVVETDPTRRYIRVRLTRPGHGGNPAPPCGNCML